MFQGTTLITLDDKGRLALPKRARDEAAADGVIVAAPVSYTHLTLPTN